MRLLVLGGTVFLSRAVAAEAVRRGHDVTSVCRGRSGRVAEGSRLLVVDRTAPLAPDVLTGDWDVVVDVARHPSWVRSAVAALPDAHWVFVSTISVYADNRTAGGGPGTLPLHEPVIEDVDLAEDPDAYGPMKVACEQLVTTGCPSSMVIRPGLVVGPEDPTGRFTYWPSRLADATHPEVLAPGSPDDVVQVVDVRDLAAWIVDSAESRRTGVVDGVGPTTTRGDLLAGVAEGVGASPELTWVPQDFLQAHDVAPWSGPRSLPVWLPLPEYAGMLAHDATAPRVAGLTTRPIEDTARDTLTWLRADPDATVTGLDRAEERAVLDAWHASGSPAT